MAAFLYHSVVARRLWHGLYTLPSPNNNRRINDAVITIRIIYVSVHDVRKRVAEDLRYLYTVHADIVYTETNFSERYIV